MAHFPTRNIAGVLEAFDPKRKSLPVKTNSLFWVAQLLTHLWIVTSKNAVGFLISSKFISNMEKKLYIEVKVAKNDIFYEKIQNFF